MKTLHKAVSHKLVKEAKEERKCDDADRKEQLYLRKNLWAKYADKLPFFVKDGKLGKFFVFFVIYEFTVRISWPTVRLWDFFKNRGSHGKTVVLGRSGSNCLVFR